MFYSGDNIGAVVADIGSYACRVGFAGEDSPRAYLPTVRLF
jgi:actin-related protein